MRRYNNLLGHFYSVFVLVAVCNAQNNINIEIGAPGVDLPNEEFPTLPNIDIDINIPGERDTLPPSNINTDGDLSNASDVPPIGDDLPTEITVRPTNNEDDLSNASELPPLNDDLPSAITVRPPNNEDVLPNASELPPLDDDLPLETTVRPPNNEDDLSNASEVPPLSDDLPSEISVRPPNNEDVLPNASEVPPLDDDLPSEITVRPPNNVTDLSNASEVPPLGGDTTSEITVRPPNNLDNNTSVVPPPNDDLTSHTDIDLPNGDNTHDNGHGNNNGNGGHGNGGHGNGGHGNGGQGNGGHGNGGHGNGGHGNGGHGNDGHGHDNNRPKCNVRYGYMKIDGHCDSYFECRNHRARRRLCPDGMYFNENVIWSEYPCSYPADVQCRSRNTIQQPKPTTYCPHQFGFFPIQTEDSNVRCGQYIMCSAGVPHIMSCPVALAFNPIVGRCDWPEQVESCKDFVAFKCPGRDYIQEDSSDFSTVVNYKFENKCRYFWSCLRGQARLLRCDYGMFFDSEYGRCSVDQLGECDEYNTTEVDSEEQYDEEDN